jgi:DNA-directed RNA polymerase beta' subunit
MKFRRNMNVNILSQKHIEEKFIRIDNESQLFDGTLGTSEQKICRSCTPDKAEECYGHMGYILLRREIPHPLLLYKIYTKLMRYCWNCKKPACSSLDIIPDSQILESGQSLSKIYDPVCSFCERHLKVMNIKWKSQEFLFEASSPGNREKYSITISELPENCKEYIIRIMPIIPPHLDRGVFGRNNLITKYKKLFLPSTNQFDLCSDILGISSGSFYGYSVMADMGGKSGIFEQEVLGKRLIYSARSVISPDPSLNLDNVSIPFVMMEKLGLYDGDIVLLNRQPTLKKHSILALRVIGKVDKDNKTISFNPCLCKGYNADFDGDEMNIFVVPKNGLSLDESENMFPSRNIFSEDSDIPVIYPHQDCLVALGKNVIDDIIKIHPDKRSEFIQKKQKEAYISLTEEEFSLTNLKKSIIRIIKSGARGSEENYKQMFETVGEQNITNNTKVMGNLYIENSFERGLSFDEMFIHCQSSREGIVSIGVNTPNSGYLEKKMIRYMGNMFYNEKLNVHKIGMSIVSFEKF